MSPFLQALQFGRVLLMDGAMGTQLQRAGLQDGECAELWNVTRADRVRAVHRAYVDAGAEILLTNTFQATHAILRRKGLEDRFDDIWQSATDLARETSQTDGWVLADLGPFELDAPSQDAQSLAKVCARCDGVLVETLTTLDGGPTSLRYAAQEVCPGLPFLVSFTFLKNQNGEIVTVAGDRPEDCALRAQQLEAAAIGVNCGRDLGMNEIIEVVHRYRDKLGDALPIFARPNAGTPRRIDGHWVYPQTAELMARRLSELFAAGVKMIGGCCGTTPEHIAAFNAVVYDWNASKRSSASDRA